MIIGSWQLSMRRVCYGNVLLYAAAYFLRLANDVVESDER
jgi:hypothetical protein